MIIGARIGDCRYLIGFELQKTQGECQGYLPAWTSGGCQRAVAVVRKRAWKSLSPLLAPEQIGLHGGFAPRRAVRVADI